MTALLLLTHEPAERVARMVDFWTRHTDPAEVVVAYGGACGEFDKIAGRKVFIDDPRLRTRDHQRERQSYTKVLAGALEALGGAAWDWLYLAEYDMLPLDRSLLRRLESRAERESADLLGHRMWRLDDTLHPHYASHLATPEWLGWIDSISRRVDKRVVLSCMGCGQFWRREAVEAVIGQGEPRRAYLELQLPTVAHHLGFRVRGLKEQDRFISNHEEPAWKRGLLRDTGGWVMHPIKNLWAGDPNLWGFRPCDSDIATRSTHEGHHSCSTPAPPIERGWLSDLDHLMRRISRVATGSRSVRILRGGMRLALGIPDDRSAAGVVLRLYQPTRLTGRAYRLAGSSVSMLGIEKMTTRSAVESVTPHVPWLREAAEAGRIGFVGCNPSHGPRCLLGGIIRGEDGEEEAFVGKLGFDGSRAAIEREWEVLRSLSGRYPGVPRPLSLDGGEDWCLLRLPFLGHSAPQKMDDPQVCELLTGWWRAGLVSLAENPWSERLLQRAEAAGMTAEWCDHMRRRRVRRALLHGDMAVWNVRLLANGPCAIDWEWAEEEGIAGIDLAHGLRQEAVMVRRLKPAAAVNWMLKEVRSTFWHSHLLGCGWSKSLRDWLAFGLLHSHFHASSDSSALLAVLGHEVRAIGS